MKPVKEKMKEKDSREKEPEESKKEGKERKENTVEGHHRFEASDSQPFYPPSMQHNYQSHQPRRRVESNASTFYFKAPLAGSYNQGHC